MTVAQLISQGATQLRHHSDSPTLDAEVLLAWTLDLDRMGLLRHAQSLVDESVTNFFQQVIRQRQRGIPVAYLTGRQAFMDFDLEVTPHTLIPRPFTESLVETLLARLGDDRHVAVDIGTGSGAIALGLAKHAPATRVIATDVSVPALRVAARNARHHHLLRRIDLRIGSLLQPIRPDDLVTTVIANLPYLPTSDLAEQTIKHEPSSALDGGPDGLQLIQELIRQLRYFPSLAVTVLELLPSQVDTVAYLLRRDHWSIEPITDGHATRGLVATK